MQTTMTMCTWGSLHCLMRLNRECGAFGARLETLVCARSDGGAGPPALKLRESTRLFGVLVGLHLVRRSQCAQASRVTCRERSKATLLTNFGAREALHARAGRAGNINSRMPGTKTSEKSWKTRSRSANE